MNDIKRDVRDKELNRPCALQFEILTSITQIQKIAADWQALHQRASRDVFGSYDLFHIWRQSFGADDNVRLHVVCGHDTSRELKAVLPFVVRLKGPIRILERAGQKVFDTGDVLAESKNDAEALWHFLRAKGLYDVALIKDVRSKDLSFPVLAPSMHLRKQSKNYFLTLDFASGAAWLASKSHKLRSDTQRKAKKLETHGAIAFHAFHAGDEVPGQVIDALYEQKRTWAADYAPESCFLQPNMKNFLHALAQDCAAKGILYLAWLSCGDTIAACHMGFIYKDVLSLYITSFNGVYGVYSPGNLLMIETIKTAIDKGLREIDFMRGDENYKQRFASGCRELSDFIAGRTLAGKILALYTKKVVNEQ